MGNSMRAAVAVILATCAGDCPAALADESGLASMHTLRREAGRLCMADHFHSGTGAGATKAAARRAAIQSWADFVNFEYGSNWARFSRARSVPTKYTKESSGWSATIEARPCK